MTVYQDSKSKKFRYEFRLFRKKYRKGGFKTKSLAKKAEADGRKKVSNDAKRKFNILHIPAADRVLFGNVNSKLNFKAFKTRGHTPLKLSIKDHRLVITHSEDLISIVLGKQMGYRTKNVQIVSKVEYPLKLSVGVIYFDKTTIDSIYEDLKNYALKAIRKGLPMFRAEHEQMFISKIEQNKLFEIEYWVTINNKTKDVCRWAWQETNSVKGAKVFKLVITHINNDKVVGSHFTEKELRKAAGDMWEDECVTYIKQEERFVPLCSSKAGM